MRSHETDLSRRRPLALLVAAHPVWNVPPFVNAALELARNGYSVILLGYQSKDLPHYERIGPGALVLRVSLASRKIPWAAPRRIMAVVEFLLRARAATMRLRPDVLITFNEPASILQKCTGPRDSTRRVSWLLEYPELERSNIAERLLFDFSSSCWKCAHTIVAPTKERLALHLALRPACATRQTLVIQNAPLDTPPPSGRLSERTGAALRWLRECEPDAIRIVYSGAIGNRYATDSLIRAAGSFPEGIRLLLLGEKHPLAESEVNEALSETDFPENIRWIDEIPYRELSRVLRSCDAGFATYRGDTLNTRFAAPGKLYEYLKNGLAILADEDCCIHSAATAAGCGFFFRKPVAEAGIREALESLLEARENLEEMKSSARNLFESRLNMAIQIAPLMPELGKARPAPKARFSVARRTTESLPQLSVPAERRP